jgi:hypothetical protein
MTCGCARHRYELLIEHGISTPDWCPVENCVGGTLGAVLEQLRQSK